MLSCKEEVTSDYSYIDSYVETLVQSVSEIAKLMNNKKLILFFLAYMIFIK